MSAPGNHGNFFMLRNGKGSRKASGSSSSSSEEDQDVKNGHGFHEGCCCEKCAQRFLETHFICLNLNVLILEKKKRECSMNTMQNLKP